MENYKTLEEIDKEAYSSINKVKNQEIGEVVTFNKIQLTKGKESLL